VGLPGIPLANRPAVRDWGVPITTFLSKSRLAVAAAAVAWPF
jgi:hypothetical protein